MRLENVRNARQLCSILSVERSLFERYLANDGWRLETVQNRLLGRLLSW